VKQVHSDWEKELRRLGEKPRDLIFVESPILLKA
jgi:hypothetical protein